MWFATRAACASGLKTTMYELLRVPCGCSAATSGASVQRPSVEGAPLGKVESGLAAARAARERTRKAEGMVVVV
jgi:hypothetical protein